MTSPIQLKKTAAEKAFPALYKEVASSLPGNARMRTLRDNAMKAFEASGLPGRRIEQWKYTNLRQLLTEAYPPSAPSQSGVLMDVDDAASHSAFASLPRSVMVFVDGNYRAELSNISQIEDKVQVNTLAAGLEAGDPLILEAFDEPPHANPLINLNLAMMRDGALICVADDVTVEKPLHFVHINSTGTACANTTRHLVQVGAGASLTIIETHAGADDSTYFTNTVLHARIKEKGSLVRIKVQDDSANAFHFSHLQSNLAEEARLRDFTLNLGAHLVRNEADITLKGKSADAHVSGAYLLGHKQHCDTYVVIDHQAPECTSHQQFRGVVDDAALGIFQGRIRVAPDAQKTDGRQMVRALLLSERAAHFSKPELEIFADDVQCAHGATIGELDDEALFFLRARGIPEPEAKALLITAFIGEALDEVSDDNIRKRLDELAQTWLDRRAGEKS